MKKDAYYFSHFSNARHDRKIKRLRKELGIEGYGIYFMLLEVLREQLDFKYPLSDIDLLAEEFGTSEAKLKTVLTSYELFQVSNDHFSSLKFIYYLTPYLEKSQRARDAAKIRWDKLNANALQMQSNCNADQNASKVKESKVNESKGEESKGEEIFIAQPNIIFQTEIDGLKTIVINDQMQMEALCMSHKIQPPKAIQLIDDFCIYLKSTGEVKKDEKDFKRHLSNWFGTTLAKEKQANKNHQHNDYNPASKLF